MFSQTLGTALGDWVADTNEMGYLGAAAVFGGLLLLTALLYYLTNFSRVILFWAAFILTRPLGATVRSEERRVGKECRSRCDWSSDVCSSDLRITFVDRSSLLPHELFPRDFVLGCIHFDSPARSHGQIGRASCRERV